MINTTANVTKFTPKQLAILDCWATTDDNIIVGANAGSGKTTVVKAAMAMCQKPALYTAFMRNNADEFIEHLASIYGVKEDGKTPNTEHRAETLNTLGAEMMREHFTETRQHFFTWFGGKYKTIIKWRFPKMCESDREQVEKLTQLMRAYLLDPADIENIRAVAQMYHIKDDDEMIESAIKLLEAGNAQLLKPSKKYGIGADFDDQIYGCYLLNLEPRIKYDYIFIDEVQDLTIAKLWLAMRHLAPGGKVMAVGDPRQAVMAFSGADSNAYYHAKEVLNAREFKMPESFRFGPNISSMSTAIVPSLEGHGSGQDVVEMVSGIFQADINEGTAVIARTNQVLVKLAFKLHRMGFAAQVKNKKLVYEMQTRNEDIVSIPEYDFEYYEVAATKYLQMKSAEYAKAGAPQQWIDHVTEVVECLIRAREETLMTTTAEFMEEAKVIFAKKEGIHLLTAHSSKGLQFSKVYILDHTQMLEHGYRDMLSQIDQDENVTYVAMTRPTDCLYIAESCEIIPTYSAPTKSPEVVRKWVEELVIRKKDKLKEKKANG